MTAPTDPATPEAEAAPESAGTTETDWKAEARKWETRAKENKKLLDEATPVVDQWKALEAASQTDLERQQQETQRWQSEAQQWRGTAVQSRVLALAGDFADPTDAATIAADPSKYLDAGGQIDEAAIKSDLAALLEQKPHWRRQQEPTRRTGGNYVAREGAGGGSVSDPSQQFAQIMQGLNKGS